jgi:hypothetical protein
MPVTKRFAADWLEGRESPSTRDLGDIMRIPRYLRHTGNDARATRTIHQRSDKHEARKSAFLRRTTAECLGNSAPGVTSLHDASRKAGTTDIGGLTSIDSNVEACPVVLFGQSQERVVEVVDLAQPRSEPIGMRNLRFRLHDSLRFRDPRTVYLVDRHSNDRADLPSNQVQESVFRGRPK